MRLTDRSAPGLFLLSLVLAGCGASTAPPGTSPSPAGRPSQSLQLPASTPSAGAPSVAGTTGPVVISDAQARAVALPWPATDPRPLGVSGSRAYYLEYPGKDTAAGGTQASAVYRLHAADLAAGTTADVLTLDPGHILATAGSSGTSSFTGFVATADHLVWVEIWYDRAPHTTGVGGDPFAGLPQHWQIVSLDVATGTRSAIASGTNHRVAVGMASAAINPPVLAVDGDRVAYTLEAATTDAPNGNKIVLQSLADGTIIDTVTSKGFVPWIGLAGTVMAYREALGTNLDGSTVRDARLMLRTFTADAGAIGVVDEHVADAAISGDRLVWGRVDATDGSAWTTQLSDGVPVHIAGPTAVGFSTGSEPGIFQVSVRAGFAAWAAEGTANGSDQSFVPFIWAVGDPNARLVTLPTLVDSFGASDGWLTWNQSDGGHPRLRGVPLGAIPVLAH